jgi:hypothetical protein
VEEGGDEVFGEVVEEEHAEVDAKGKGPDGSAMEAFSEADAEGGSSQGCLQIGSGGELFLGDEEDGSRGGERGKACDADEVDAAT